MGFGVFSESPETFGRQKEQAGRVLQEKQSSAFHAIIVSYATPAVGGVPRCAACGQQEDSADGGRAGDRVEQVEGPAHARDDIRHGNRGDRTRREATPFRSRAALQRPLFSRSTPSRLSLRFRPRFQLRPFRLGVWLRPARYHLPVETADKIDPGREGAREASPARVFVVWLLSVVIRLWCRTLRFEASPAAIEAGAHDAPSVLLVWHNRLFVAPYVRRKLRHRRGVCALVSASRDGAALAAYFRFIDIRAVRGSTSRLGREALRELIAQSRAGNDVAVTPDGPRGPIYSMRAGALLAARRAGVPLVLLGFRFPSAWRLPSWDAFYLPKPFSRVQMRCEVIAPDSLDRGNAGVEQLRVRLLEVNGEGAGDRSEC